MGHYGANGNGWPCGLSWSVPQVRGRQFAGSVPEAQRKKKNHAAAQWQPITFPRNRCPRRRTPRPTHRRPRPLSAGSSCDLYLPHHRPTRDTAASTVRNGEAPRSNRSIGGFRCRPTCCVRLDTTRRTCAAASRQRPNAPRRGAADGCPVAVRSVQNGTAFDRWSVADKPTSRRAVGSVRRPTAFNRCAVKADVAFSSQPLSGRPASHVLCAGCSCVCGAAARAPANDCMESPPPPPVACRCKCEGLCSNCNAFGIHAFTGCGVHLSRNAREEGGKEQR